MHNTQHYLWRSGSVCPSREALIHVNSVGHASVSAVFEGINAYADRAGEQLHVFRLREHLRRLLDSTRLSRLATDYGVEDLEAGVLEVLRRNECRQDVHIRPWTFAADNPLEQMVEADCPTETVIDVRPFRSGLGTGITRRAAVVSWTRIGGNSMPPRVKAFSNYHNGRLGNIEAKERGADWPIFLNERSQIAESSGACVGMVKGGVFSTPPLSSGVLQSVTRATVLRILPEILGVDAVEREIDRTDLYLADEVFFLGTSAEVLPIVQVDSHRVGGGGIGPVTEALQGAYEAILRGEDARYKDWLTPVWP